MLRRKPLWRPKAYLDSVAAGQSLQTILMKWTAAWPGITGRACQEHMSHLGMHQPMKRTSMDYRTATDAGANGQVDDRIAAPSRTVCGLRYRSRVDVGVKGHRHF